MGGRWITDVGCRMPDVGESSSDIRHLASDISFYAAFEPLSLIL
jgi:hypothetical protein